MSRNRDITTDELRNAAKNYVKDTGLDNNMTEMFDKIYDWEKLQSGFPSMLLQQQRLLY